MWYMSPVFCFCFVRRVELVLIPRINGRKWKKKKTKKNPWFQPFSWCKSVLPYLRIQLWTVLSPCFVSPSFISSTHFFLLSWQQQTHLSSERDARRSGLWWKPLPREAVLGEAICWWEQIRAWKPGQQLGVQNISRSWQITNAFKETAESQAATVYLSTGGKSELF